jgi:hypothetical protein
VEELERLGYVGGPERSIRPSSCRIGGIRALPRRVWNFLLNSRANITLEKPMTYIDITELEVRARRIAAIKMGLVKDPDGTRLPDDLWRQCLPAAKAEAERDRQR